ncbi:MAG: ABC transporter substrate-binding protein, partial [Acidimicrobiales bacterium]|nr:ABC transporter substrate-binding protein [Acidimicrobiales bacterium]
EGYRQRAAEVGIEITLRTVEQATLIDNAIAGQYQAMLFRNYPGGEPDQNYIWWYGGGNPVNFGGWDDPELNALLDEGRETADTAERKAIYQDVNRLMTSEVYALWTTFVPWVIVTAADVHDVIGPTLPDGEEPNVGLATGHSLLGLWVDQ